MKTTRSETAKMVGWIITIAIMVASTFGGMYVYAEKRVPPENNTLNIAEIHELQHQIESRNALQSALNTIANQLTAAFQKEDTEVADRIKAAHSMHDGDTWDLSTGKITRKAEQPKPTEPAPIKPKK